MTKEQLLEKHVALLEEKIARLEQELKDAKAPKTTAMPHPGYGGTINTPYVGPYQPSFGQSITIQPKRCDQGCDYNYGWNGIAPQPCRRCNLLNPLQPLVTCFAQTSSGTQQQANQNVTLTGGLSVKP